MNNPNVLLSRILWNKKTTLYFYWHRLGCLGKTYDCGCLWHTIEYILHTTHTRRAYVTSLSLSRSFKYSLRFGRSRHSLRAGSTHYNPNQTTQCILYYKKHTMYNMNRIRERERKQKKEKIAMRQQCFSFVMAVSPYKPVPALLNQC